MVSNTVIGASETRLRHMLVAGKRRQELQEALGADEYAQLHSLAVRAAAHRRPGGPRVYILPGIMGSKLGYRRRGARADTLVWIDPEQIEHGRLLELALPAGSRCHPLGVMVLNYLKLKLTLELAGFDVDFHPYDWRQGIDALGRELGQRLAKERARSVALVAHSMGGLVSRAALGGASGKKIGQLIMLATPNGGSFAPLLALRGVYPAVRRVATLDPGHSAERLTQKVFGTFPGLYHMLPPPQYCGGLNLYDAANWPAGRPAPRRPLLRGIARVRAGLAGADRRCIVIAGVNQETVTGAVRSGGAFEYRVTRNGDGTVPLALARLDGARTYHVEENHASIPANSLVCSSVVDLLHNGKTSRLEMQWHQRSAARPLSETQLRQTEVQKRAWPSLPSAEQRRLLQGLVFPVPTKPG